MATSTGKSECVICKKEKATYGCDGCSNKFCMTHLSEHHQSLGKQLDDIENQRNLLRQNLTEQKTSPEKHLLFEQINRWEQNAIRTIQKTAEEQRELIFNHINEHFIQIEMSLDQLTKQLKDTRKENDFNEIILHQLKTKVEDLGNQLNQPTHIKIQKNPTSSFIKKISVVISSTRFNRLQTPINAKWTRNGITVAGGNDKGDELNQIFEPWGIDVDDDQTIYVADPNIHRIVKWKKGATSGEVVAGGNGQGNRNDQLNFPLNVINDHKNNSLIISDRGNRRVVRWSRRNGRSGETIISNIDCLDLALDNDGYLYVSDIKKYEVRRWKIGDENGTLVAGGNGKGDRLDQFNEPRYIFVDQEQSVYVSDYENHRVMKWVKGAKEGIIVAGGQGQGNSLTQLSYPNGIIVDQMGTLYVTDGNNDRVMRWLKRAREGEVIVGGCGEGKEANQFNDPIGLSFDRQNNLYVLDQQNHRVQKFPLE